MAQNSRHVRIEEEALRNFATSLAPMLPAKMQHSPHHFCGEMKAEIAYFLVLDSLNFGSAFLHYLNPYKGETGYFIIATALRDWIQNEGAPSAARLLCLEPREIAAILGQDSGDTNLTIFFNWCAEALHDLGRFVKTELAGEYCRLTDLTKGQASSMVELLTAMPKFRDMVTVNGTQIFILKRAQIFVHDLAIAASQGGWGSFEELDQLTIFADNVVPAVLRANRLLAYDAALDDLIDRKVLIGRSHRVEVELRANAIHACELLRQELRQQGIHTTARHIDFALWNLAETGPREADYRYHLTQSWFY